MKNRSEQYGFDSFFLNASEGLLMRGGSPVPLTPKAFDTLLLLIERRGHVVTKDEIMQRVWADSFVEENNLSQNISLLRKTIGAHYIETIPKRGYRFTAQVASHDDKQAHPPEEEKLTQVPSSTFAADFVPETRYARSGDVHIAYQVLGAGELDMVFVMGWVSHLEYFWREPSFARFLKRLASMSRLIVFDKRGTGLSDRVPLHRLPTLEQRMDDVRAVLDAVGSRRAVLCGVSEGGPMSALFAATYPEMTTALVMIGTYAKRIWSEDYPYAPTRERREAFYDLMEREWGGAVGLEDRAPSMKDDAAFRQWWATYLRMGASPGAALALTKMNAEIDVRQILPTIRVPTLVIHRQDDACLRVAEGRYVADRIPGARFIELPGADHLPFVGDQDAILDAIEKFLSEVTHATESDRVLATILIARLPKRGDDLSSFVTRAAPEIERFRGRIVRVGKDEIFAAFDGPARAIRAACAMNQINSKLRCGLHTGECDVVANDLRGLAIEFAGRIAAQTFDGEILVSSTVRDLVAGSGIKFHARGTLRFSDTEDERPLFAVETASCVL